MRRLFLPLIAISITIFSFAQNDSTTPPYQRFPTVPPFDLLMSDSVSHYTKADLPKNKSILIILFDPNCDHCQHEMEEILKNIDSFANIQIVMATNAAFSDLRKFYQTYTLDKIKNIKAGIEPKYLLASFFAIRNLPYLAMYDEKGRLLSTHEGSMKIENILKVYSSPR